LRSKIQGCKVAFFNYAQEIQHERVCSQIGAYLVEVAYL